MLLLHTSTAYTTRTLYWSSAVMCCAVSKEPLACHPVPRNAALWKKSIRVYQSTSASIKYCILSLQSASLKNTDTSVKKCCYMFDRMYLNGMLHPAKKKNVLKRFEFTHIYLWHPLCQKNCCDSSPRYHACKNCMCIFIRIHTHQKHT